MPFADDEARRKYQRQWARRRRAQRDPGEEDSTNRAPDERSMTPGAKASGTGSGGASDSGSGPSIESAEDVLAVLVDELASVRSEQPTLARARVVASLGERCLRAFEVVDHAERLAAIEERLNGASATEAARRRWGTS